MPALVIRPGIASAGWVVALLTGVLALGQQVPLGPPANPDDAAATASIVGYVVRAGGDPLGKAQVMLRPVEGRSPVYGAVTEASGAFVLANIRPGSYRLYVERDGYVDQEYGQISSSRPGTVLVLADGQEVRDVLVSMVPTGTIAGRVFDEDGEPIVGASVRALRFDYEDGERVLNSVRQAETNDLGEYRLYWLTPGEYRVAATFEARFRAAANLRQALEANFEVLRQLEVRIGGEAAERGALLQQLAAEAPDPLDEIYVDTYYPGTNDPLAAAPIQVGPATEIRAIDFTVLPTRAVTVSGQVVGPYSPDDGMVPSVNLVPRSAVGGDLNSLFRGRGARGGRGGGRDGTFSLTGVPPGSYTIVAQVRAGRGRGRGGGGQPAFTGFADIEVGSEDLEGVLVPVQPGIPVTGRVLVDPNVADLGVSRLRIRLEPAGSLPVGSPNARVDENGAFVLDDVPQTEYRVSLTGLPEDAYVAEARAGATDVLASGIAVTPDTGPIQFRISGPGSRIDGIVQVDSDAAFTGAQVVLVPADSAREDLYKVASADQYGRFGMNGIAPGRYRVFAWEDAPSGAYRDPEFVRRYDGFGEPVQIDHGTLVQIQPRLIPAGIRAQ